MAKNNSRVSPTRAQSVVSQAVKSTAKQAKTPVLKHAPRPLSPELIERNQSINLHLVMLSFNACVSVEYAEESGVVSLFFNIGAGSNRSMLDAKGFPFIDTDFLRGNEAFLAGILHGLRVGAYCACSEFDQSGLNEHGYGIDLVAGRNHASVELMIDVRRLSDLAWYQANMTAMIEELSDVLSDAAVFVGNRLAYDSKAEHNTQEVAL